MRRPTGASIVGISARFTRLAAALRASTAQLLLHLRSSISSAGVLRRTRTARAGVDAGLVIYLYDGTAFRLRPAVGPEEYGAQVSQLCSAFPLIGEPSGGAARRYAPTRALTRFFSLLISAVRDRRRGHSHIWRCIARTANPTGRRNGREGHAFVPPFYNRQDGSGWDFLILYCAVLYFAPNSSHPDIHPGNPLRRPRTLPNGILAVYAICARSRGLHPGRNLGVLAMFASILRFFFRAVLDVRRPSGLTAVFQTFFWPGARRWCSLLGGTGRAALRRLKPARSAIFRALP